MSSKSTRARRTPEQMIADAEAKVAELKAKAEARDKAEVDKLLDQRSKLTEKADDLQRKIAAIDARLADHGIDTSDVELDFDEAGDPVPADVES